ncbi:CCT domain [Sesbania bispinosa]|nr:CCT domain [Sesbania bispinosa]
MSSCLSGTGGRTYGFDLDFVKSPSSWSRTSQTSSSPSSTISESSNSQLAISTRKPRTPRKRPNQTYNEAAALLSTAYPNLFSTKNLKTPPANKFSKPEASETEDFDAESILDEEIEEGIDSIMGSRVEEDSNGASSHHPWIDFGGKFDFRLGLQRAGVRALRHVDDGNWWNFPAVDILQISPKINGGVELNEAELPKSNPGLMLKLNFDDVRNAWSDRGSPFADDSPASDVPGSDVTARLSQIDLLWDNGGVREASVLRYKEKRRTRLFSKKIRYQVRKVNADRRPRMKGRFVRRPNSSSNAHR